MVGHLHHHRAARDAADPGGARGRRDARRLAAGGDPRARPAQVGPLRGRHARGDPAGARARLCHRRRGDRRLDRAHHRSAKCCPNVLPQLVVVATVEAASAILLEAALSFLGLGVQPPLPSWGLMIAEAKVYMFFSFWLIAIPARRSRCWCSPSTWWATACATSPRRTGGLRWRCSRSTGSRSTSRRRAARCMRCATCRSTSSAARRCASSASPAAASR